MQKHGICKLNDTDVQTKLGRGLFGPLYVSINVNIHVSCPLLHEDVFLCWHANIVLENKFVRGERASRDK
jgi:hypothetical protein